MKLNKLVPSCNKNENVKIFSEIIFYKLFFLAANLKLMQKGFASAQFSYTSNLYFPYFFSILNPFYLNLFFIIFTMIPNRTLNVFAAILAWVLMVHPNTLGAQHYVTAFWTILWLVQYDRSKQSIWIGKLICSMIFFCAAMGKLTEGWWSGDYIKNLTWTHTYIFRNLGPSLFSKLAICGEICLGTIFLIPGILGPTISIILISGMFATMSLEVLDALGPIYGMLLSILTYEISSRAKSLSLISKGLSKKKKKIIAALGTNIQISDHDLSTENRKTTNGIIAKNDSDEYFCGIDVYIELIRRVPILLPLYLLLKVKLLYRFGEKVYSLQQRG